MIQIVYAPREQQDAEEYSEILGYSTEDGISKGVSRAPGSGGPSRSENTSDQKRALMLPQELREMGMERIILLTDDCKPIFADKIFYYKEKVFQDRLFARLEVPAIDVDSFIARRENRVRDVQPGEVLPASRLAVDLASMPHVTPADEPIAAEVSAMADWLFSHVKWTTPAAQSGVGGDNEVASQDTIQDDGQPSIQRSNTILGVPA